MSHCHDHAEGLSCHADAAETGMFRRIAWIALAINVAMFVIEIAVGIGEGSVALQADALDFFGDAANYGVSLTVAAMSLHIRARAALVKGAMMAGFGIYVLIAAVLAALDPAPVSAFAMGWVGTLALLANLGCAALLYRYREAESNRRSAWICSRNDAAGNLAVLLAASGVFATGTPWPDLFVGSVMAVLGIAGAVQIARHARAELAHH